MLAAETLELLQEAGRHHPHAGGRLHERLDDEARDSPGLLAEQPLELRKARPGALLLRAGEAVRVRERHPLALEEERAELRVEEIDPPDAHRADRVAVVAVVEGDEEALLRPSHAAPVREGDLQPDLHGSCAGVREEHLPQPVGREPHEPLGELDRRHVRHPEQRGVRDLLQLPRDRLVQLRPVVPVDVDPERRVAVVVLDAVDVEELHALAPLDHDRLLGEVGLHLREGVPEVAPVLLEQLRVGGGRRSRHCHSQTLTPVGVAWLSRAWQAATGRWRATSTSRQWSPRAASRSSRSG